MTLLLHESISRIIHIEMVHGLQWMSLILLPLKQHASLFLMGRKSYGCVEPLARISTQEGLRKIISISNQFYVPQPFPKHLIDPLEWTHVLATLSTCALPKPIQFCDPDGYDIVPIRMLQPVMGQKLLGEQFYETIRKALHCTLRKSQ